MNYKHFPAQNFEDYASGRVVYSKAGNPNYPVRMAGEIFMRCIEHIGKCGDEVCLYDPCCGGAYLLTVLGFICNKNIKTIYGSDISEENLLFAQSNLMLLSNDGLEKRKTQLATMYDNYNKECHKDAMNSIKNLSDILSQKGKRIKATTFVADMFDSGALKSANFKADIIIADVPYGSLTAWSKGNLHPIDTMLNTLRPVLSEESIIAISSDKQQKINNSNFIRVEKIIIGKRKIELLRMIG